MKFKLTKILRNGLYYCNLQLSEFDSTDQEKANRFGYPRIVIKYEVGDDYVTPISNLNMVRPFGFQKQQDADNYVIKLKAQIEKIKEDWNNLTDAWTSEEVI